MKPKFLGKNNKSQNKGGKNLLDIIDRVSLDIKYGLDIWNIYDFMYLDNNKIPSLSVLEISIPASSKFLIESKSMKLYLNHFYNKSYKSKVRTLTKKTLASCEKYKQDPISDNKDLVQLSVNEAFSLIDKAVKKNVLHKNNGANKKSRINKLVKTFLTSK